MIREEAFFETEKEIFTALRDGGFSPKGILDIGASNGDWTVKCMEVFPKAIYRLYEPLYSHLEHYTVGLQRLAAGNKNVTVRQAGLADKVGTTSFYITPNSVGSSLLPVEPAQKIDIEVTTLDRDLADVDLSFDIIKMDTQGGELKILKGAKTIIPRASVILVESWLYRGYGAPTPLAYQIIEELSQYDFHVFNIGGPYFHEGKVLYALDLYFARSGFLDQLEPIANTWFTTRV